MSGRLRGLLRLLNLNCRDASRLLSDSCDRDLPRGERSALRLHTLYCSACRRYGRQLRWMGEAFRKSDGRATTGPGPPVLPPEARARIVAALEVAGGGPSGSADRDDSSTDGPTSLHRS